MPGAEHTFDTSTPAVVLKLAPNVMHHGGLGAIRSLGRMGVPVYGVHEGPHAPVASSRYLAGRFFWQAKAADPDDVTEGLARIAERIGRPSVLFATDDAGALFLAERGSELRRWFLFPEPAADLPRRLADKFSLSELCLELGMPVPEVSRPDSLSTARDFAAHVGFPVIAKLTSAWASGGVVPSTSIVRDQESLADLYRQCEQAGLGLMLQEYIPGGAGHDWFFHGYCDAASICSPAFTGVKLRSFPLGAGGTTYGRSAENGKLREQVLGFLARLGYRGIMDLDIRLNPRDGQYNVLDFNPRIGAQFRIFEDTAGMDVVRAAYLDLTGQAIPAGSQLDDRSFMAETYDPLAVLAHWRRRELGLREWLSSVRTLDEPAWFARDDLRPFTLMCLRMTGKTMSRPFPGGKEKPHQPPAGSSSMSYQAGRSATRDTPQ